MHIPLGSWAELALSNHLSSCSSTLSLAWHWIKNCCLMQVLHSISEIKDTHGWGPWHETPCHLWTSELCPLRPGRAFTNSYDMEDKLLAITHYHGLFSWWITSQKLLSLLPFPVSNLPILQRHSLTFAYPGVVSQLLWSHRQWHWILSGFWSHACKIGYTPCAFFRIHPASNGVIEGFVKSISVSWQLMCMTILKPGSDLFLICILLIWIEVTLP